VWRDVNGHQSTHWTLQWTRDWTTLNASVIDPLNRTQHGRKTKADIYLLKLRNNIID